MIADLLFNFFSYAHLKFTVHGHKQTDIHTRRISSGGHDAGRFPVWSIREQLCRLCTCGSSNRPHQRYMWQSRVEIEGYSVAYFDRIAAFKAPYR